jgi:hypothetical protein
MDDDDNYGDSNNNGDNGGNSDNGGNGGNDDESDNYSSDANSDTLEPDGASLSYSANRPLSPLACRPPYCHSFNLPSTLPSPGTQVELRDLDFIWCPATIVSSSSSKRSGVAGPNVLIRYDGWPSTWDEVLAYPNDRLARLYTYTKRVRAWVKSNKLFGRWPVLVSIRMPQPGSTRAEHVLALENKCFVEFYPPGPPTQVSDKSLVRIGNGVDMVMAGGVWCNSVNISHWKSHDLPKSLKALDQSMSKSKSAIKDSTRDNHFNNLRESHANATRLETRDLMIKPFKKGSLLSDHYRVVTGGGEVNDAIRFTGEFRDPPVSVVMMERMERDARKSERGGGNGGSSSSSNSNSNSNSNKKVKVQYAASPVITNGIALEKIPYNYGISWCITANKWEAAVSLSGNRYTVGFFEKAVEAALAYDNALRKINKKLKRRGKSETLYRKEFNFHVTRDMLVWQGGKNYDPYTAHVEIKTVEKYDLAVSDVTCFGNVVPSDPISAAIPLAAYVEALDTVPPSAAVPGFSLHSYLSQSIRHQAYLNYQAALESEERAKLVAGDLRRIAAMEAREKGDFEAFGGARSTRSGVGLVRNIGLGESSSATAATAVTTESSSEGISVSSFANVSVGAAARTSPTNMNLGDVIAATAPPAQRKRLTKRKMSPVRIVSSWSNTEVAPDDEAAEADNDDTALDNIRELDYEKSNTMVL